MGGLKMREKPLEVFVAMPGHELGGNAIFETADGVKKQFLEPIRQRLKQTLGCEVKMKIEKDENRTGNFGKSMFKEAFEAEVYIADLTGANPNVYLELGVRWAAADNITVLVIQDMKDYRSNIGQQKVIEYGRVAENLEKGIDKTVEAIVNGLQDKYSVDSEVRLSVPAVTRPRDEWQNLERTIDALRKQRGEEFLNAATSTNDLQQRINFLRNAIDVNPLLHRGRYELGRAYENAGNREDAQKSYEEAIRLSPQTAEYHKGLGVLLSRWGEKIKDRDKIERAVAEFETALGIDGSDADVQASLGGAMRRLAIWRGTGFVDIAGLLRAQMCYDRATQISNGNNPYPLLNSARIEMLLAAASDEPEKSAHLRAARDAFAKVLPLCQYKASQALATEDSQPWWPMLDQHDCLLFSGQIAEAAKLEVDVRNRIPETDFLSVRDSFLSTYQEFLNLNVLEEGQILDAIQRIVREWST
jgi:tetratricopeptide (TPR) repeat protein